MAEIHRTITARGVPLTAPSRPPEITLWRSDTWTLEVVDQVMTHRGRGKWSFTHATAGVDFAGQIDADPASSGQVTRSERYHDVTLNGVQDERLEVDLPAIPLGVWLVDLTPFDSGIAIAGEALNAARQFATNRFDAIPGSPDGLLGWYQDDGTTLRYTMTLNDHTGGPVLGVAGVPARRGPAV